MAIPMKKGGVDPKEMKKDGFGAFAARYRARQMAGAAAAQDGKTAAMNPEPADDAGRATGAARSPQARWAEKTLERPSSTSDAGPKEL